ncbi:MAG: TraX family protein [Eubacteriales bacterium]|nr:TraX family protein [Eubacteriales bacterium]
METTNSRFSFHGFRGFNGSTLKMIAIITMLIDHTAAAAIGPLRNSLPDEYADLAAFCRMIYPHMRSIGRLAFPIFCFLLVEGFFHTRNAIKYAERLALFCLISEFPYDYALKGKPFYLSAQNVYFTLLIAMLVMIIITWFDRQPRRHTWQNYLFLTMQMLTVAAGLYLAQFLHTDYGYKGVLLILVLFFLRPDRNIQAVFGALAISWERYAPFAFLPIWLYNGERGRQHKYFFYWFYPGHLIILGILRHFVLPMIFHY